MNEQELVRELDASRGELEEWDDPEPAPVGSNRKSEKRQRGVVVSVRLTPTEFEQLQELAAHAGLPVSTFLRDLALARASGTGAWRPDIHHQTGASTVVSMLTPYVRSTASGERGTTAAASA